MTTNFDLLPDDLRVRFCRCSRWTWDQPTIGQMFSLPYSVISVLLRGRLQLTFAERGRRPLVQQAGQVCVLPASFRRKPVTQVTPAEFIVAGFLFEIHGGLDLLSFFDFPERLDDSTNARLRALLEELYDKMGPDDNAEPTLRQSVLRQRIGYAILETLLPAATPKPGLLSHRRLLPIIEMLNEHYLDPPAVEALVTSSGLSRTHFFRSFKELTGVTPFGYVKRRRLREAGLLLQESDLTVAKVGQAVGWPDQFYFSRLFKQAVGLPPTVYRVQCKKIS